MTKKTSLIVGVAVLVGVVAVTIVFRATQSSPPMATIEDNRVTEMTRATGETAVADETFDDQFVDERAKIKQPEAAAYLDNEIRNAENTGQLGSDTGR